MMQIFIKSLLLLHTSQEKALYLHARRISSPLCWVPLVIQLEREPIALAQQPERQDPDENVRPKHRGDVAPHANVVPVNVIGRRVAPTLLQKLDGRVVEGE